jgi:hypothetical protein
VIGADGEIFDFLVAVRKGGSSENQQEISSGWILACIESHYYHCRFSKTKDGNRSIETSDEGFSTLGSRK